MTVLNMSKEMVASRVWGIANKLRGTMDASQYKDYILGFIFYKFLSDKQEEWLKSEGYEEEDIDELNNLNYDSYMIQSILKELGFFIKSDNYFSTWLNQGRNITIADVNKGFKDLEESVDQAMIVRNKQGSLLDGILKRVRHNLNDLGSSDKLRNKAVSDLIQSIRIVPTKHDGYDVLGYIYEYLIAKFASDAGSKSGEFYTPHEISMVMAEIIADTFKEKDVISVYDPTSGSGSLLITIGSKVHMLNTKATIKYYAQEYNSSTEILTRMNLFIQGIDDRYIETNNGDSLSGEFPYNSKTGEPTKVDVVVSNPPYSTEWDSEGRLSDPQFSEYGLPPKKKADYAFLLHGLYHLDNDGVMIIVLPHGTLFRQEEKSIRKNLIEKNQIDSIIGLPANVFYGTGIATTLMVLRKNKKTSDVQFIDASLGFVKNGKKNIVMPEHGKKISDVVTQKLDLDNYSTTVSRDELIKNDYNLNINLYVNASPEKDSYNLKSTVDGVIPTKELNNLVGNYFDVFPSLKEELIIPTDKNNYVNIKSENVIDILSNNTDYLSFRDKFYESLSGLDNKLFKLFFDLDISNNEKEVQSTKLIFDSFKDIPLIDKYRAYGILDDRLNSIMKDLELINSSENSLYETSKLLTDIIEYSVSKSGEEVEKTIGTDGLIIPLDLIKNTYLSKELAEIDSLQSELDTIDSNMSELIESLSEEDAEYVVLNNDRTKFSKPLLTEYLNNEMKDLKFGPIDKLTAFLEVSGKKNKLNFIKENPEVDWSSMEQNSSGYPSNPVVKNTIQKIQMESITDQNSFIYKVKTALELIDKQKLIKDLINEQKSNLNSSAVDKLTSLTDDEIEYLLEIKWVKPLMDSLYGLLEEMINEFDIKIQSLVNKYHFKALDLKEQVNNKSAVLSDLLSKTNGDEDGSEAIETIIKYLS